MPRVLLQRWPTLLDEERLDIVHVCTPPPLPHAARARMPRRGRERVHGETARVVAERDRHADRRGTVLDRTGRDGVPAPLRPRCGPVAAHGRGRRARPVAAGDLRRRSGTATTPTSTCRGAVRWDSEGGGPTMGHGIHQFDLMLSVLGPWQEIRAVAARQARDIATEDVSMALVTFADGTVASVVNSVAVASGDLAAAVRLRARHGRARAPLRLHRRALDGDARARPRRGRQSRGGRSSPGR